MGTNEQQPKHMSGSSKRQREQVPSTGPERVIPSEIASLFEQPPLLPGEDAERYNRLLTSVSVSVEPKDVMEWLWVKDVVDLLWEAQRLRRLRTALLTGARRKGLHDLLREYDEPRGRDFVLDPRGALVHGWSSGDPKARKQVDEILTKHGLSFDVVFAKAFSNELDDLDRLDRMIANAEARRAGVLREIERRRSALGARLRAASDQIVDVELIDAAPHQSNASEGR